MNDTPPIRVMESDTPETNAREWPIWPPNSHGEMFMVPSDFARKLERERNEAKELAEQMSESNQVLLAEVKHCRAKTERVLESSQENNLKLALEQVAILAKALKVERDEARECAVRYRSLYYTRLGIEGSASFFPWEESK
jgi:mevalonate kinase